ncbi:hypothetical protein [Desulforhabdus amnigena]|uniref:hypothetical protein n=1 Tax=Desulforhabdus amnigena TaxID=40218 RepID=UPI0016B609FB|nr:hypothetical protein [Desulforhabdus amnigena]NLJ27475.1 hypothetical protein [Deltaproteobacteria bacterium]
MRHRRMHWGPAFGSSLDADERFVVKQCAAHLQCHPVQAFQQASAHPTLAKHTTAEQGETLSRQGRHYPVL